MLSKCGWQPLFSVELIEQYRMYQKEYDLLLEKIDKGTAKPCFALDVINGAAKKEFEISEVEKIYTWSSLIEAGSDTSRVAIQQMMAAAACYPEWAQKARKLLDEVLGENAERLPSLKDRPALPYITAVVKETLRWRPFNQSGFPRTLSEDDEYEGYRFPAGTEFTWNAYSIALNENEYDDPLRFIPERFLNDDIKAMAKGHWAFGAGMTFKIQRSDKSAKTISRTSYLCRVECRR